jgi:hypothetical protein
MFHGAYLITKVTHSIVPNNMTTVFTGTRIRIAKTPLIDKATLYSSLISGQEIGGATAGSTVSNTGESSGTVEGSRKNTKLYNKGLISKQDFDSNQKVTLDILKKQGLTREQTAGVMGNMYAESGFVPTYGGGDVKSESWGLIAWNVQGNGFNTKEELFAAIGKTAESQVNSLFKVPKGGKPTVATTTMVQFLIESKTSPTADNAAFLFAKNVERCSGCNYKQYYVGITVLFPNKNGVKVPTKINPSKRSEFANDFYLRFNDPNDILFWGSVIVITQPTTTLDTIIIGDSLSLCVEKQVKKKNGKARMISPTEGEASLHQGGKNVTWLIGALQKYPVSPNVKNVIISIGTNGGFSSSDNQSGLMTELKRVFPNAKYIFITGSFGWSNNVGLTQANADTYYNVFKNAGATIITGIGYASSDKNAHSCDASILTNLPKMADDIIREAGG